MRSRQLAGAFSDPNCTKSASKLAATPVKFQWFQPIWLTHAKVTRKTDTAFKALKLAKQMSR